jgi:hypothetical protein
MCPVALSGPDHTASLSADDWLDVLALAEGHGWRSKESRLLVFAGPGCTLSLPRWTMCAGDGEPRVVDAEEAEGFALCLRTAVSKYRNNPPAWWRPGRSRRARPWSEVAAVAWEVIHVFSGGTVTVQARANAAEAVGAEATTGN